MRGIVFSATGEGYVTAAVKAALRSASLNPLPHAVFCSPARQASGLQMIPFEASENPHIDKISNMLASPFEETIYLDVDCQVIEPLGELFDLLEHYDIAAAHAPGYRGAADQEVPVSFYEINTGVVAYRGSDQVLALMRDWRATYRAWLADPPFEGADGQRFGQDQPAFRRCLWRSGIAIYVLGPEYNWRFLAPSFLCGKAKVIHGFVSDPDPLAAAVNRTPLRARVYPRLSAGYGLDNEHQVDAIVKKLNQQP
jgi:hypothetical protein